VVFTTVAAVGNGKYEKWITGAVRHWMTEFWKNWLQV